MDILQGIIIGIVQGLTEFLPVSSSAHLVFIQNILGVESSLAFDTFLHLGSLLAVLWFFRGDIIKMLRSWWLSIGDILESTKCQVCVAFGCGPPIHIRTTENHQK